MVLLLFLTFLTGTIGVKLQEGTKVDEEWWDAKEGSTKNPLVLTQESGSFRPDTLLLLVSGRILAISEWHLGCPPRLPDPSLRAAPDAIDIVRPRHTGKQRVYLIYLSISSGSGTPRGKPRGSGTGQFT